MANSYERKFPEGSLRITTGCQYCAVGCGYNAFLVPDDAVVKETDDTMEGVSRFITPAMTNTIKYKGKTYKVVVAPDVRCDLNKGNHSVRGGSQGDNLVNAEGKGRSTDKRLKSPKIRFDDGELHEISWDSLNEIIARLIIHTTEMKIDDFDGTKKVKVNKPYRLGAKIFEYQYLENTYAGTKLLYSAIGTPNVAFHDRPSAAGSSPALSDVGFGPHDFSYDDVREADVLVFIGTNPYENHSVFFMQYCQGKKMIVIDPRKTSTAQYAESTKGFHVQPEKLGGDSILFYSITYKIVRDWLDSGKRLEDFPLRSGIGTDVNDLPVDKDNTASEKKRYSQRRRASRALNFNEFAEEFLNVRDDNSQYHPKNAAEKTGLKEKDIEKIVNSIFDIDKTSLTEQPKVAIFYEKGIIWGFNYHNIASIGSLGLLLGAYSEPGRLVGRVGGHQKGWAESQSDLSEIFINSNKENANYKEGYPFRNVADHYTDDYLKELKEKRNLKDGEEHIKVKHNIDNHLCGVPTESIPPNAGDYVTLPNGLKTKSEPDINLLWIIGGNYLGQTNNCQEKRKRIKARLLKGSSNDKRLLPRVDDINDVEKIADSFINRIDKKGLVIIHQDIFENPTTNECDIVIPAAGWGEDTFCRYNAQRRLKLYDRFQDMPLHDNDKKEGDPFERIDDFKHSPKPDWMIFRDVIKKIGEIMEPEGSDVIYKKVAQAFNWKNSSDVADEMAWESNRKKLMGDMVPFGREQGLNSDIVHTILGKRTDNIDGTNAPLLKSELYSIPGESLIYGNQVATNGVMLPVKGVSDPIVKLEGTLSDNKSGPFYFIGAPWKEIENHHTKINEVGDGEMLITNGRFNHLWNNMFHHIRNEYVNKRYPSDMPGTVLEINMAWAEEQNIENGQVVRVTTDSGSSFLAVASKQRSASEKVAFALFSYPVQSEGDAAFNGYANNITYDYADGIHPIAALKYGKAIIAKEPNPDGSNNDWIFETSLPNQGITYEQRNVITKGIGDKNRLDWEMRELIVRKGLPRAFVHSRQRIPSPLKAFFTEPDSLYKELVENTTTRNSFLNGISTFMKWPMGSGKYDYWYGNDKALAETWGEKL